MRADDPGLIIAPQPLCTHTDGICAVPAPSAGLSMRALSVLQAVRVRARWLSDLLCRDDQR